MLTHHLLSLASPDVRCGAQHFDRATPVIELVDCEVCLQRNAQTLRKEIAQRSAAAGEGLEPTAYAHVGPWLQDLSRCRSETEKHFGEWLQDGVKLGMVGWWAYEPFVLRLGPKVSYTPDFIAQLRGAAPVAIEIKGTTLSDGKPMPYFRRGDQAKVRLAAQAYGALYRFQVMHPAPLRSRLPWGEQWLIWEGL